MPDIAFEWEPLSDLPPNWADLHREDLLLVQHEWHREKDILKDPTKIRQFQDRLSTEWAIETGVIEKLYTLDRGVTETLIELGLEAIDTLHNRGAITHDAARLIEDQKATLELVFDFVKQGRELTAYYIKELHVALTGHQSTTEAVDQFGQRFQARLLKGAWKRLPNNPTRPDGSIHEYCPPDFVQDEIDQLLRLHQEHQRQGVAPEIEAAWLHHRFAQIHPFQDGNGRVARTLATLVFLRHDYLPLVVRDEENRDAYLTALESADHGDLGPLVGLMADIQVKDLHKAVEFLRTLRGEGVVRIAASAAERVKLRKEATEQETRNLTDSLTKIAETRLREIRDELVLQFQREGLGLEVQVRSSNPHDGTESWWGGQIVAVAKQHRYWADLSKFRTWAELGIRVPSLGNTVTHIVLSFHHKETTAGLMVATAFVSVAGTDTTEGWEVIPNDREPFTFSTTHRTPEKGFREWLDQAVEAALDQWQSKL